MRPWAQWTARTALLAAGACGLSGVALAAPCFLMLLMSTRPMLRPTPPAEP